jgi:hypothetical protein
MGVILNMYEELVAYATAEALKMGLQKSVVVRIYPKLFIHHYLSRRHAHEIRLGYPSISGLRHELGHAYMNEKHPKLYRYFSIINKPIDFLCTKFGWFGPILYSGFCIVAPLLSGILSALSGKPEVSLPLISLGITTSTPFLDEFMAVYFGRKYCPAGITERT